MSQFSGAQGRGAMKARREQKRAEAVARDAVSAHEREGRKAREGDLGPARYLTVDGFTARWSA